MAVISEPTKVSVAAKLNNGTKDGKVQTKNLNIGDLNVGTYETNATTFNEKAMNVVNLLKPCLNKDVYEVQEILINVLRNAE
ncbi:MAG: hypothetical protein IJ597_07900 [Synergistaceae bacterium]|nr:hypothetical protein [Synergistaceae bacterium]